MFKQLQLLGMDFSSLVVQLLYIMNNLTTLDLISHDEILATISDTESCDITPVRASLMQQLVSTYINELSDEFVSNESNSNSNSNFTDELQSERLVTNSKLEIRLPFTDSELINNIFSTDELRSDRLITNSELEIRLPFADP